MIYFDVVLFKVYFWAKHKPKSITEVFNTTFWDFFILKNTFHSVKSKLHKSNKKTEKGKGQVNKKLPKAIKF